MGLFAAMDIKKGEVLGTYSGRIYAHGWTVKDVKKDLNDKYPDPDKLRDLELLISLTDDEEYFEAHDASHCRPMQLINSPENTQFSHNCIFDNRDIKAITDIPKGTEFLIKYGKGYWSGTYQKSHAEIAEIARYLGRGGGKGLMGAYKKGLTRKPRK